MEKNSRLLRIGVLGAGPISQSAHFDACRKAKNAELYAICDAAGDLAERAAAVHGPRVVYTDFDAMLADPLVEAVIIGAADAFHVPLSQKAVVAGKHVLVEKPLGLTIEECESLRRPVQSAGVVFQIGNNLRFDPGNAFARRFVVEELGQMLSFKGWYHDSTLRYSMTDNLQPIPFTSQNTLKPASNPKADKRRYFLLTHGSHLVDLARFLAGEITSLRARLVEKSGAFCWFVEVDFASGCLGHLDLHIPIQGDFEEGYQISGEWGSVRARGYLPWFYKSSEVECFSIRDRQYHRPLGEDAFSYKLQVEGFAAAILDGAPQHGAGLEDGIAAVRALAAIARSVETGERVFLNEVSGGV
jgi:predicted dehydrogenase